MNDYYKDELLNLVDSWSVEQLDDYIAKLIYRLESTREQITELKALKRRKLRNSRLKENGPRDGR